MKNPKERAVSPGVQVVRVDNVLTWMRVDNDTGTGLVTIDFGNSDPLKPWPFKSILFHNFNFDGAKLKPEHIAEIDNRLIPQILNGKMAVRISGYASKKGDANYNWELSRGRAMAVRNYLKKHGVPEGRMPWDELRARGEYESKSEFDDDEIDRSVKVDFVPPRPPPPRPPPPRPPPLPPPPPPPPPPPLPPPPPPPPPVPPIIGLDPGNQTDTVVLREVYINRRLVQYEHIGKSESVQDGWRRIDSLTVEGTVVQRTDPGPCEKKVDHVEIDRDFFISVSQAICNQREEYDTRVYFYEYEPESSPRSAGSPKFPTTQSGYWTLYFSGTLSSPPPMG